MRTCNINKTYVDEDDQKLVILFAADFASSSTEDTVYNICSTENKLDGYCNGQLIVSCDINPPQKKWIRYLPGILDTVYTFNKYKLSLKMKLKQTVIEKCI